LGTQRGDTLSYLRILALSRYGTMGASSRLRFLQYLPALSDSGLEVHFQAFFDNEALSNRYMKGRYGFQMLLNAYLRRVWALLSHERFDLLWIEKEALPWFPALAELTLLRGLPYVLDYDDAVFHNYDQHRLAPVRWLFGRRLDKLMAKATLVVGGNIYLANRAKNAGAPWVEILPTVIDLERYPLRKPLTDQTVTRVPRIVWIGSPSTVHYLQSLQESLQQLARCTSFILRVVGAEIQIPNVQVECAPWSEATEVDAISECDLGVMPLEDSSWEHGKCGYKLIQYMACGLPVVASPVGVNSSLINAGECGFLADGASSWQTALEHLLTQPELRMQMGNAGRRHVEQHYCLQVTAPKMSTLLHQAGLKA
jgi:glycosyltransferase involved in cell wall biosynthesis